MKSKANAYMAALPASALPELQELIARYSGGKGPRGNVVMVRLGDSSTARLDELVEAGLFGSRSEAAAFLIGVGVEAQKQLFERIARQGAEIKKLRQGLRRAALDALRKASEKSRSKHT